MHIYTTGQWAILFYFYCLCGWIWESCYVSARKRQWVNRGFLQGPWLPIYGSGAILILFSTLPVEDNWPLVFLCGMVAATALEYVTGAVMERLFRMRYWDYSTQFANLNGYICLTSSLVWGGFSLLLVYVVHPPIARLLSAIPAVVVDPLALLLTAAFTVDTVKSVQAAVDLRETLERLTEENEELRRLAKRAEVYAAFAEDELRDFRERTEIGKLQLQNKVKAELAEKRDERTRRSGARQMALEESLRRRTEAKLSALHTIRDALENYRDHLGDTWDQTEDLLTQRKNDLAEALERVRDREETIRTRSAKTYQRSLRILKGNPSARTKPFSEAMEILRQLGNREK